MEGVFRGEGRESGAIARCWLLLSVLSLVFAGIDALMVALARTPGAGSLLPSGGDYIYVALVGHVVLAVVIWFLSFEGFLWVYASTVLIGGRLWSRPLAAASLICSASGVLLVVVSSLFALGPPVLANYVPVLAAPVFYAALLMFAAGICGTLFNTAATVWAAVRGGAHVTPAAFGIFASGAAVSAAFLCFALSGAFQYASVQGGPDFELLFWGGGHILQFANTIAMAAVWLCLLALLFNGRGGGRGKRPGPGGRWAKPVFIAYFLFILPAPFIYFFAGISHPAHKEAFTWLMRWGLGPVSAVFVVMALREISARRGPAWRDPGFSSLVLSMAVFAVGGAIGYAISGSNTIIPAHYHSSIGAVTIAFMGLFYKAAPLLERPVRYERLASVQPWLYSIGVAMFSLGLFLAGYYGVARKTYGAAQQLDTTARFIGMSVMGLGSLVAIAGGLAFVYGALATMLAYGRREAEGLGAEPERGGAG